LLQAAAADGLTILWVAVGASLYKDTEIAAYQAANNPARPLNSLRRADADAELVKIAEKIKEAATRPIARRMDTAESEEPEPSTFSNSIGMESVLSPADIEMLRMLAPRRLDINQYKSMVAKLCQFRGQKLRVLLLAEHEPRQYGESIIRALKEAGWTLEVICSRNSISQPTYGLHVYGPHPESSSAIQALISALVEAGNPVYSAGSNDAEFFLSITLKPEPGVSITTPNRNQNLWHLPLGSNWTL